MVQVGARDAQVPKRKDRLGRGIEDPPGVGTRNVHPLVLGPRAAPVRRASYKEMKGQVGAQSTRILKAHIHRAPNAHVQDTAGHSYHRCTTPIAHVQRT